MFHQLLWLIFGIQNCKLSEYTDMSSLQTCSSLQYANHLICNSQWFIVSNQSLEFIRMNDDVHSSSTGELIFLSGNTCHTYLLPGLWRVRFFGSFNSLSELLKFDQAWSNFGIVFHYGIKLSCSFIQSWTKAFVSYFLTVSWICAGKEIL
jgi:hypothetical protein